MSVFQVSACIFIAGTLWFALPAHATKPCMQLEEATFRAQVAQPATMTAEVEVVDFSTNNDPTKPWTKVKILNVLKGRQLAYQYGSTDDEHRSRDGIVTIAGWQANDYPLSAYRKGDHLVVFLVGDIPQSMRLVSHDWCVPAYLPVQEGTVYFHFATQKPMRMTMGELKAFLSR